MGGLPDRLPCGTEVEDLVALVWDSLPEPGRERLERHAASCEACRAELSAIRTVREALEGLPEARPAAGFRAAVMSRARALARGGAASRRLAKIVERERILTAWLRPRWRLVTLGVSVAACVAFLIVSRFIAWERPAPRELSFVRDSPRAEGRAIVGRWKERRECAVAREARVEGSTIDVSGIIEDGYVVLTGVADVRLQERCLIAFRASDWENYSRRGRNSPSLAERERFRALESARQLVRVSGGRLEVPEAMLVEYLAAREVVILGLQGRTEIWARKTYEEYSRSLPPFIHVDMDDLGLAPDAPARSHREA